MTRYPPGYRVIANGNCPFHATQTMACMFCNQGHLLECHQGMDCHEAQCDHLLQSTGGA